MAFRIGNHIVELRSLDGLADLLRSMAVDFRRMTADLRPVGALARFVVDLRTLRDPQASKAARAAAYRRLVANPHVERAWVSARWPKIARPARVFADAEGVTPRRVLRRSIVTALAVCSVPDGVIVAHFFEAVRSGVTEDVTEEIRGGDHQRRDRARKRGEDVQATDPTDLEALAHAARPGPQPGSDLADVERALTAEELARHPVLTDGQRDVLALDLEDRTSEEIADLLETSEDAVRQRRYAAHRRLREALAAG